MDYRTNLSQIFSLRSNVFAVPNYQRAYSWERDKQVTQFLKDLKEHPKSVNQYHFGHFLFETDETNKNKFWIIDGQQRLTTSVIFLACIYNKIKKIDEYNKISKNIYSDYLRNTDDEQKFITVGYDNNFFTNIVIDGVPDKIDTRSRRRIKEAFDYFTNELDAKDLSIEEILEWKNLIENAKITTDTVADKSEATQLFTFQNDRGKDLTELEKLKSFLMFNIYLVCNEVGKNPNDDIAYIEEEFKTIYQSLEQITIANEDQILNYHTIAFLSGDDTSLERVKKIIRKEKNSSKWIRDFSVALKKSFSAVIEIQTVRHKESILADMLYLDQYNSFPVLLKLFHFHKIDEFIKSMRLLEIILFKMVFTIGNYRTNRMHSIALNYNGKIELLEKDLLYYSLNGFKEYWSFTSDFLKCLAGNFHYWPISRYLLWKYENRLRADAKEPEMRFTDFENLYGKHRLENTLDHWAPQKPEGIEYTQEFKDNYLNNIGNLVLATRGRNSSDSNDLPAERETHSILIQRQKLEPYKKNWGELEIKNRQREIVHFAKEYWNPENLN
jgi:uncharacterized protein with ParB-like and HNH nuclease domain